MMWYGFFFISQITSFWLPYIRTHLGEDHKVPVILVGNKCDLMDFSTEEVKILTETQQSSSFMY